MSESLNRSVQRFARPNPDERTNERTNEEVPNPPLKSFTSVTRTRTYRAIAGFQPSAALRANLNRGGFA